MKAPDMLTGELIVADEFEFAPRLDRIETRWSLVRQAHEGTIVSGEEARKALVMRYSASIRGYIAALTRDDDSSDEIAQDVVVRMLRGDFGGADSNRGRFRDLLKVAVRNMVRNHWEKSNRRRGVEHDLEQMPDDDESVEADPWLDQWRDNLMNNAWTRLEAYEQRHPDRPIATVLGLRARFPDDTSQQLADRMTEKLGRTVRADSLRQQLRRARLRLAEFVVEEIADGLDDPTRDRIQEELIHIGLFEQLKDALPADWQPRSS